MKTIPAQMPAGTANVVFVFHRSYGQSRQYLQQALFGNDTFFSEPQSIGPREDGLFAGDDWKPISAVYLAGLKQDGSIRFYGSWKNPNALVPLPDAVSRLLEEQGLWSNISASGNVESRPEEDSCFHPSGG
jgi:hypothetical protein